METLTPCKPCFTFLHCKLWISSSPANKAEMEIEIYEFTEDGLFREGCRLGSFHDNTTRPYNLTKSKV